ncbi:hypothetical protein DY000_02002675 [Brassica cretica]|uniref:Uncharacterized protein n=1 Tax=Brassica cretica TaxID=69181 RepID=A0ABQ7C6F3_BRACR|nr:hypothetical protein DY000_02002675 [Brassica cretica]
MIERNCLCVVLWPEVLRELFSAEPISLRAVASGRPKLPGSDSRFNLVQSFAASGRYQTGRASGLLF